MRRIVSSVIILVIVMAIFLFFMLPSKPPEEEQKNITNSSTYSPRNSSIHVVRPVTNTTNKNPYGENYLKTIEEQRKEQLANKIKAKVNYTDDVKLPRGVE